MNSLMAVLDLSKDKEGLIDLTTYQKKKLKSLLSAPRLEELELILLLLVAWLYLTQIGILIMTFKPSQELIG